jgi:hypothetical protein
MRKILMLVLWLMVAPGCAGHHWHRPWHHYDDEHESSYEPQRGCDPEGHHCHGVTSGGVRY